MEQTRMAQNTTSVFAAASSSQSAVRMGRSSSLSSSHQDPRHRRVALSPERGRHSDTSNTTSSDNATPTGSKVTLNQSFYLISSPANTSLSQRNYTLTDEHRLQQTDEQLPQRSQDPRYRRVALSPKRGRHSDTSSIFSSDNATPTGIKVTLNQSFYSLSPQVNSSPMLNKNNTFFDEHPLQQPQEPRHNIW